MSSDTMTKPPKIPMPPRRQGKSVLMERMRDDYIKANPDATIVTFRNGEMIIEKPVKELPKNRLPKPER